MSLSPVRADTHDSEDDFDPRSIFGSLFGDSDSPIRVLHTRGSLADLFADSDDEDARASRLPAVVKDKPRVSADQMSRSPMPGRSDALMEAVNNIHSLIPMMIARAAVQKQIMESIQERRRQAMQSMVSDLLQSSNFQGALGNTSGFEWSKTDEEVTITGHFQSEPENLETKAPKTHPTVNLVGDASKTLIISGTQHMGPLKMTFQRVYHLPDDCCSDKVKVVFAVADPKQEAKQGEALKYKISVTVGRKSVNCWKGLAAPSKFNATEKCPENAQLKDTMDKVIGELEEQNKFVDTKGRLRGKSKSAEENMKETLRQHTTGTAAGALADCNGHSGLVKDEHIKYLGAFHCGALPAPQNRTLMDPKSIKSGVFSESFLAALHYKKDHPDAKDVYFAIARHGAPFTSGRTYVFTQDPDVHSEAHWAAQGECIAAADDDNRPAGALSDAHRYTVGVQNDDPIWAIYKLNVDTAELEPSYEAELREAGKIYHDIKPTWSMMDTNTDEPWIQVVVPGKTVKVTWEGTDLHLWEASSTTGAETIRTTMQLSGDIDQAIIVDDLGEYEERQVQVLLTDKVQQIPVQFKSEL